MISRVSGLSRLVTNRRPWTQSTIIKSRASLYTWSGRQIDPGPTNQTAPGCRLWQLDGYRTGGFTQCSYIEEKISRFSISQKVPGYITVVYDWHFQPSGIDSFSSLCKHKNLSFDRLHKLTFQTYRQSRDSRRIQRIVTKTDVYCVT